jgi:hypothetical protein
LTGWITRGPRAHRLLAAAVLLGLLIGLVFAGTSLGSVTSDQNGAAAGLVSVKPPSHARYLSVERIDRKRVRAVANNLAEQKCRDEAKASTVSPILFSYGLTAHLSTALKWICKKRYGRIPGAVRGWSISCHFGSPHRPNEGSCQLWATIKAQFPDGHHSNFYWTFDIPPAGVYFVQKFGTIWQGPFFWNPGYPHGDIG